MMTSPIWVMSARELCDIVVPDVPESQNLHWDIWYAHKYGCLSKCLNWRPTNYPTKPSCMVVEWCLGGMNIGYPRCDISKPHMCAFVRLNSSHPFLSSNTCPAWFQAKGSRSSSDKSLYTNEFWILPYELETYPVLHSTRIKIIDLICFADVTF